MLIPFKTYCYQCHKVHELPMAINGVSICPNAIPPMQITIDKLRAQIEKERFLKTKHGK